jgi:hypothetical protein
MVPDLVEKLGRECIEPSGFVEENGVARLSENLDGNGLGSLGFQDVSLLLETWPHRVKDRTFPRESGITPILARVWFVERFTRGILRHS